MLVARSGQNRSKSPVMVLDYPMKTLMQVGCAPAARRLRAGCAPAARRLRAGCAPCATCDGGGAWRLAASAELATASDADAGTVARRRTPDSSPNHVQ